MPYRHHKLYLFKTWDFVRSPALLQTLEQQSGVRNPILFSSLNKMCFGWKCLVTGLLLLIRSVRSEISTWSTSIRKISTLRLVEVLFLRTLRNKKTSSLWEVVLYHLCPGLLMSVHVSRKRCNALMIVVWCIPKTRPRNSYFDPL